MNMNRRIEERDEDDQYGRHEEFKSEIPLNEAENSQKRSDDRSNNNHDDGNENDRHSYVRNSKDKKDFSGESFLLPKIAIFRFTVAYNLMSLWTLYCPPQFVMTVNHSTIVF